jgi:hypothetical protein
MVVSLGVSPFAALGFSHPPFEDGDQVVMPDEKCPLCQELMQSVISTQIV